jgi:1A family penicillin-binding protein
MPIPQFRPKNNSHLPAQHWKNRQERRPQNKLMRLISWVRRASWIKLLLVVGGLGLAILFLMVIFFSLTLPSPNKLIDRQVAESTKIYDREGKTILYEIHGDQKRTLVALDQIPKSVRDATIAIEDKDFYRHGGFSVWAIFRTAVTDVLFRQSAGGSTLTQQFVKNAILTNEKKITRKIKELILAYQIEKKFSKDEILQMYLNEIPYGSSNYGVESASQFYFGKNVKDINLAEAAILAALPQAPSRYSPYGPNKDLLIGRQRYILDQMAKQGYISQTEADNAKQTELKFQERLANMTAPHFVMYLKQILEEKYGDKEVEQGGLKIYTTLDIKKQEIAETAVKDQVEKNAKNYNAKNAAFIAIDPKTGEVLAMVGSKDYFDDTIDGQVNVAIRPRQPGSSLKPVVYSAAFLRGYTPDTMVYDAVTNFSTDPSKKYEPHNYDGGEHGPISFRAALAGSLNIPAVKAMYLAGIDNVMKLAQSFGYSTLNDKDRFGLSLVLGGGEVTLLEHTAAFGVFAREGEKADIVMIRKIEDKNGKILEEFKEPKINKVLDPNVARMINSILSDNASRAYIFGASNYLTIGGRPIAAKTGTTNDYHDAWTIGYTPSLVAGVWVGNSDNEAMKRGADGSQIAAPIWNRFMKEALANSPVENFSGYTINPKTRPILLGQGFGSTKVKIDKLTGLLANDNTPETYIVEKNFLQPHDLLYFINKNDPNGAPPFSPDSDPQFNLWEAGVKSWIERQIAKDPNFSTAEPPTESDTEHRADLKPSLTVFGLTDGLTINDPQPDWTVQASAPRGTISRAEYLVNGQIFAVNYSAPYGLNRPLTVLANGQQQIGVRVCDDIDNCAEQTFSVVLNLSTNQSADFTIGWLAPTNNTKVAAKNLPIILKINLTNPEALAQVKFMVQPTGATAQIVETKRLVRSESEQSSWSPFNPKIGGDFEFWAEATGWSGQTKNTPKIKITYQP